jgi:hypothetical protein
MSTTKAPDLARLEALRGRFEDVALKHPGVNALVVYQPDIRREDTQRQVQEALERRAESNYAGAGERLWEAARFAHRSAEWVPPFAQSVEELGCQTYWTGRIFESSDIDRGVGLGRTTWECRVYGPPIGHINDARSVFSFLAADASKLVLAQAGDDRDLITKWLIHLATQKESEVVRPRRFLDMSAYPHPSWPHVNPLCPLPWWTVRLDNVFHHSRDTVLGTIDRVLPAEPIIVERRAADQGDDRSPPPNRELPRQRLVFDDMTRTVTLDGRAHEVSDPKVYEVYRVIAGAIPGALSKAQVSTQVKGVHGSKTIPSLLKKLPEPLRKTIETGPHGYSVVLPRLLPGKA